jgi:hypothetical protein
MEVFSESINADCGSLQMFVVPGGVPVNAGMAIHLKRLS